MEFPNRHDRLLTRLAHLARPDLDGARFWQHAPSQEQAYGPPRHVRRGPVVLSMPNPTPANYVLGVELDGQRFEVEARSLGDWYDLDAVVGMLNALLARRGSARRIIDLGVDPDGPLYVAAAPAALEQALTEGLIAPPSEGPPEDYNRPSPVDIAEAAAVAQGLPLEPKAPELSTHVAKHVFAAVGTASEVSVPPGQLLTPLGRWDGKSHFVAPGLPCTNEAPCSADEHEFERATRVLTAEELLQQARKIYPAG